MDDDFQVACAVLIVHVCLKNVFKFMLPCSSICIFFSFYRGMYLLLGSCNGIQIHNHLDREQIVNHFDSANLAKGLSACLRTMWLWVRIPRQPLKLSNIEWRFSHV